MTWNTKALPPLLVFQTALHLAIITDQPLIVEQLLKAGCDASLVDDHGNTALHIACRKGSLACFGLLTQGCSQHLSAILQTPNYNGKNDFGECFTCLFFPLASFDLIWMWFYFPGQKCIHVVAIQGYLSLLESLIQLGADINAQVKKNIQSILKVVHPKRKYSHRLLTIELL